MAITFWKGPIILLLYQFSVEKADSALRYYVIVLLLRDARFMEAQESLSTPGSSEDQKSNVAGIERLCVFMIDSSTYGVSHS